VRLSKGRKKFQFELKYLWKVCMEEPKIETIEEIVIAVKDVDRAAEYFKDLFGMEFGYG